MKKELYEEYFKNKKVTVMGLGLLGRGIGDTAFLAKHGAGIIVTDMKTKEALQSSLDALLSYTAITYHLGEHMMNDFEEKDFILKAAGVPYDSPYIVHAKKSNVPIYMSAALVCRIIMEKLSEVVIIGVTGTRGKSTVTEMIAHMLRTNHSRVHVGGNVRGVANLPILEEIEDGDFLVLELDSWQLQGFHEMKISPHIAVFTTFMDDHMNYYKNDREMYFNDKAAIYRYQHEGNVLIVGHDVAHLIHEHDKEKECIVPEVTPVTTTLIGKHNEELARLTYEVGIQCGLDDESIRNSLQTFSPVEGRLQYMGEVNEVHVYNDNNATTPDASIAAIIGVYEKYDKKPTLIMGGTDKGLPLEKLEEVIREKTKVTIYLSGTGTDRITLPKEHEYEDLKDCIAEAFAIAEKGDVILFSPAFASFSKYFNNEYERNDLFLKEIEKIKKGI